ncbi:MAG TPA: cation:proton antiporter [Thermoplasmata archaeon]|nr:cation:proton antiporter [Thermoplasmata archaeon]
MDLTLFLVGLFILLAAAVLVGELMTRLHQAALVGQLAVGVLLGPTLLGPLIGLSSMNEELVGIQFLATFFILVMAGLEVSPEQIWRTGLPAALLGVAVFLGPFLLGAVVLPFVYPGLPFLTGVFVSLTLSITALPVMGIMLAEFRLGRTPMGLLLINAAVINELAAVTVFAILLQLDGPTAGGVRGVAVAIVSVVLFLSTVLSVHMGLRVLRESRRLQSLRQRFRRTWKSKEAGFAVLMVMALGAALYSQFLGLTFLVGAFYAGLLITPESAGRREHRSIGLVFDAMTWGFFIPLFFAFVGLGMDLRTLATSPSAVVAFALLVVFAIGAKFGIGAAVARGLGWSSPEARTIGFLVSSRGAVELAMAVILLQLGVFSTGLYTVVAGVGLVTTVAAPIGASYLGSLRASRLRGSASPPTPLEPAEGFGPLADPVD